MRDQERRAVEARRSAREHNKTVRVLVVDDDRDQLIIVERSLRLDGFQVATSAQAIGVSSVVVAFKPDVVLIDVNIPGISGDRLLSIVRRHAPPVTKLVLFSACDEVELRSLAAKSKADGWLSKTVIGFDLAQHLRKICDARP